ncbi:MAG TPA: hypothetical protein EYP08_02640 [Pyrodictiaceae archaeon]|nr:hypothetical protein [Pyrodictiaceae archaeon]HIQ10652.1 hypothetical protein [Pyrodictium sp.]HIQ55467.1 hypothetical protein [Pyrodictium sp.]
MEIPTHVAIGNINIDIYLKVHRIPGPDEAVLAEDATFQPGGAASNYAVAVAKAGHRVKLVAHTTFLAKLLGVLERLELAGVDVSTVTIHADGMPGMVFILLLPDGESTMIKLRGVNELLTGEEIEDALPANVAHFASVAPNILENAGKIWGGDSPEIVSYDPGGAVVDVYRGQIVQMAQKYATLLTLNKNELEILMGDSNPLTASRLIKGRLQYILIRYGEYGAFLVTRNRVYRVKPCKVGDVVDTTGAGDTFNAYFNVYLVESNDIEKALVHASVAAGIKVTRFGAQSSPSREEVELLAKKYGQDLVERIY